MLGWLKGKRQKKKSKPLSFRVDQEKFFQWILDCSKILKSKHGITSGDGADLISDTNWFMCYDDKMTPEEAVAEYMKECGVEKQNTEICDN